MVDSNIIGMFRWDADGRIIDANKAYLHIIGYDRGDLIAGRLNWKELEASDEELRRDRAEAIRVTYVAATRARDSWGGMLSLPREDRFDLACTCRVPAGCGRSFKFMWGLRGSSR